MKDSRKIREVGATFIVGGLSVVVIKFALGPEIEKAFKAKAR